MKLDTLVHDPGGRWLRKAGRTSVVMSASFLFGLHVVHNSQFAVVAAFTAAAVLGIADFSGRRSQRLWVTAATLVVGAVLLAIGTAVSTSTAAASATMFVVTLAVCFSAVFSGYFAAASSAVVVFYVVATGVEGPVSVIAPREAGLAFGGALSLLAAGWLWPSRTAAESRVALARVYRELAAQVAGLASGPAAGPSAATGARAPGDQLGESILEAERAIAAGAWRPDGLAGPQKARMYMLHGARRMAGLLEDYRHLPAGADRGLGAVGRGMFDELASQLDECAEGVVTYGRVLPDPEVVERAKSRFTAAGHERFAAALAGGQDGQGLGPFADWYFVVQQLCWGTFLAAIHCRVMHNAPLDVGARAEQGPLVTTLADGRSATKWARRARRNLTLRSVHLQNSLRLATGLALARLAVGLLGLQHGFWVGFATLVVLKTSAAGTRSTALQAAVGTAIGFAVSSALITTFGVNALIYSIVLPVVVFAAFYLPGAVSFIAGQACFTMVIVVLFNLLKPAGWTVGLIRLLDVVVGAAIGLVIGMAIWPRGASAELSRVVGRLFATSGEYAQATIGRLIGRRPDGVTTGHGPVSPGEVRVATAAVDTEDVFSQYLAEPHQSDAPVMAWASLIASAHQVWFGASLVAMVPPIAGAASRMPDALDRLAVSSEAMAEAYRDLGRELAEGGGPVVGPAPPATEGVVDRSEPDASLTVLELEAWLAELASDLDQAQSTLDQLGQMAPDRAGGEEPTDQPSGPTSSQSAGGVA